MQKKLINLIAFVVVFFGLTIGIFPVMAQISPIKNCTQLGTACTGTETVGDLRDYIWFIVNTVLALVGLLAAGMIIYGGVKYIIARGDESAAEEAKKTILYAVIGLVVIGLSAAIVRFVVQGFSK